MIGYFDYLFVFIFFVSIPRLNAIREYDLTQGIISTCKDAEESRLINHGSAHCNMISWQYANAYYKDGFDVYNPGSFLSPIEHLNYAIYVENQIIGNHTVSKTCGAYVRYFSCVDTYPHCPMRGDNLNSPSYFETCRLQCLLVNNNCPFNLNCSQYATNNCGLYIPSAYVAVPVEYGEFASIVTLYIWLLPIWVIFAFYWNLYDAGWEFSLLLSYTVRHIPTCKVVVVAICIAYWQTCNNWLICSYWMGVSILNIHLVHISGMMFLYSMIACGFGIRYPTLPPGKWKAMMLYLFAFYMANSTMVVLQSSISPFSFFLTNCIIYGLMYCYILANAAETVYIFSKHALDVENNSNRSAVEGSSNSESESSDEETPLNNESEGVPLHAEDAQVQPEYLTNFHERHDGTTCVKIGTSVCQCLSRWISICCYYSEQYHGVLSEHAAIKGKMKFQFYYRRDMYICFSVLVLINMVCECYAHVLLMRVGEGNVEFWMPLLCYEVSNVFCILMVMYIYRPKRVSPFFYAMPIASVGANETEGGWLNPNGTANILQTPSTVEVRQQRSQSSGATVLHSGSKDLHGPTDILHHKKNRIVLTSLLRDADSHIANPPAGGRAPGDIEMRNMRNSTLDTNSSRNRGLMGMTVVRQPDHDIVVGLDVGR